MARRQTTGTGLSADEAFTGLVDYGLFSEKLPPSFTSAGLAHHRSTFQHAETEENPKKSSWSSERHYVLARHLLLAQAAPVPPDILSRFVLFEAGSPLLLQAAAKPQPRREPRMKAELGPLTVAHSSRGAASYRLESHTPASTSSAN